MYRQMFWMKMCTFLGRLLALFIHARFEIGHTTQTKHVRVLLLMIVEILDLLAQVDSTSYPSGAIAAFRWQECCMCRPLSQSVSSVNFPLMNKNTYFIINENKPFLAFGNVQATQAPDRTTSHPDEKGWG